MSLWYDIKHKNYAPDGKGSRFFAYVDFAIKKLKESMGIDLTSHTAGTSKRHNAEAIDYSESVNLKQALDTEKSERVSTDSGLRQSLNTAEAKLENKLNKGDVVNSLTSTDTGKVLSAAQGKILNDTKVNKISGKILSSNDFTSWYKSKIDGLDTNLEATYAKIGDVGDVTDLTTTNKTSLVDAVNELESSKAEKSQTGDISNLTTTAKASLVAAINELEDKKVKKVSGKILSSNDFTSWYKSKIDGLDSSLAATYAKLADVGDKSDLTISNMDSLVAAINYLEDKKVKKISGKILSSNDFTSWYKSKIDGLDASLAATYAKLSDVGSVSNLNTTSKTIVGAINELKTAINALK